MHRIKSISFRVVRTALPALLVLVPASTALGQAVRAYTTADTVMVGDRFQLIVAAEHSRESTAVFPTPPIDPAAAGLSFGDLEVLSVQDFGSVSLASDPAATVDSVVFEVTTFALDTAFVASIPVTFVAGGDSSFALSQPFMLFVASLVPADAETIKDLAPIASFPPPLWPWVLAVAALAAAGAYWWYRVRNPRMPAPPVQIRRAPVEISPIEEARKRLEALETFRFEGDEPVKRYYIELSDILRTYLSRRIHLPALETSTAELMEMLPRVLSLSLQTPNLIEDVHAVLNLSDLAKFAEAIPTEEKNRRALAETGVLILRVEEALRPRPEGIRTEHLAREKEATDGITIGPSTAKDVNESQ